MNDPTKLLFLALFVWFIFHIRDRIKNPEKWKVTDFNIRVDLFIVNHQNAFERIPKSEWVEMNASAKANVFRKREKVKAEFFNSPQDIRDAIKQRYSFDDTFQGVD